VARYVIEIRGLTKVYEMGEVEVRALAGVDLMEIDTHLADIPGGTDRTVEVCMGMVQKLIGTVLAD